MRTATPEPRPNAEGASSSVGCLVVYWTGAMVFLALAVWIWAFLECIPTVINDEAIECDPIPLGGKVLFTALAAAVSAILAVVTGAIVAHLLGESTWGRSSKGSSR